MPSRGGTLHPRWWKSSVSGDSVVCDAGPDAPATATTPAVAGERGAAAKSPRGMDNRPIVLPEQNKKNKKTLINYFKANAVGLSCLVLSCLVLYCIISTLPFSLKVVPIAAPPR